MGASPEGLSDALEVVRFRLIVKLAQQRARVGRPQRVRAVLRAGITLRSATPRAPGGRLVARGDEHLGTRLEERAVHGLDRRRIGRWLLHGAAGLAFLYILLPLIFSNQPMADRMGAAFFLGDNI